MKTKHLLIQVLLLLTFGLASAQTGVTVTYYDATTQQFNVTTAGKLYFSSDNLNILSDTGSTVTTIPVTIIQKVTFSEAFLSTSTFGTNSTNLVMYPNPSSDFIKFSSSQTDELKVSIYNLSGQLVLNGTYSVSQEITVSNFASGLYLVQVNGVTFKLSKK
ncbi:T9SS type A sorting domain-containing protein [Flavobacterium haoranii]|uniref:Por secretion system C-terminal sorting domain-containing protein n=1 Tax=Flavobacterium haoranii TaxID=683124 RepID=A0A1M6FF79_9FLAO|nr:T9SS type A sorting domain-containing protein [Flavobacterium haoranii]SHI96384.1 Por secretion system C-terminal sorting domain-containing protein [Flavobacterium haoranii]